MIQLLTKVNIIDNTGGLQGRCIKIIKPHNRDYGLIGDIILVSVIKTITSSNIKKGDVFKALIVRTKSSNAIDYRWSDNAVILLSSKDFMPIGTRIKGAISRKLIKKKGNYKYLSLAKYII